MKERHWYVVRTNIKCEERAAKSLRAARIRVYVPKMRMTTYHHRTKKRIDKRFTLFNRYLFVSFDPSDLCFGRARDCDGVESFLGVNGTPFRVSRKDVAHFMLAQRAGHFDKIDPRTKKDAAKKRYAPGTTLRVRRNATDHPFGGFYGQVVKVKGRGVVQAMLEVFGGLTPVELRLEDIEPVDKAA